MNERPTEKKYDDIDNVIKCIRKKTNNNNK